MLIAAGLALTGKKAFVYAIAPFITFRCLEQIRVENAMMQIPITIVGVGAGFGYEDSGPTHHIIEDLAVLRAFPNLEINSITDSVMAAAYADLSCTMDHSNYVRLDRQVMPDIYREGADFRKGLTVLKKSSTGCLLSTGRMTHAALEVEKRLRRRGLTIGVIDIHSLPLDPAVLLQATAGCGKLITLEEHFLAGGLGSAVGEVLADSGRSMPLKRLGLSMKQGYCYEYGGRQNIHRYYGIDLPALVKDVAAFLRK
jgi:transketolase